MSEPNYLNELLGSDYKREKVSSYTELVEYKKKLEEENRNLKDLLMKEHRACDVLEQQIEDEEFLLKELEEDYEKAERKYQIDIHEQKYQIIFLTKQIEIIIEGLLTKINSQKVNIGLILFNMSSLAASDEEKIEMETMKKLQAEMEQHSQELQKLVQEHEITKKHIATLEIAFADTREKYERSKAIIIGYKNNEETLLVELDKRERELQKLVEKFDNLKAHAEAQIQKANEQLSKIRSNHKADVNRLVTIVKRLEIKINSKKLALDQKTHECAMIAELCEDVTSKIK